MFPKNQFYLISYLDKDTTLNSYKEIIRLDAMQPDFLDQCMEMDLEAEFNNSMVIFDDCDSITSKKMKEKIFGLLNKMLRIGRHYNITVAYVGHELYHSHELKCILNESMTITFFPRFLNFKKMKYLLETYLGLSKEQIDKIRAIRDRSVTFIKGSCLIHNVSFCKVIEKRKKHGQICGSIYINRSANLPTNRMVLKFHKFYSPSRIYKKVPAPVSVQSFRLSMV